MIERKRKRIIFIVNCLNVGGTERIVVDMCNNLNLQKYETTIISLSEPDANNSIFDVVPLKKEIKLLYYPYIFESDFSIRGYFKLISKSASHPSIHPVIHLIESLNPDIVHFHTSPRELIIGNHLKKGIKKVYTDHSLRLQTGVYGNVKTFLLARMFRKFYRNFHVITVSEAIRENLIRLNILNTRKKNLTLPNVIDTDFFKNTSSSKPSHLSVIYVARLVDGKGHEDLIKAWSLLNIPDKRLMLVGPDLLNGRLQRLATELNCKDTIDFTDAVSNPREWMQKANIAVFPSHKEGLPLSLLEKMSMELAVIASDIKELANIIHDGENGLLFKCGDPVSLSEKLKTLYDDKALRERLGISARTYVKKYHHMKNLQERLEIFYSEI